MIRSSVSTHSRPKAAGPSRSPAMVGWLFQLTAARRRLARAFRKAPIGMCFNSQPPEGGWMSGTNSAWLSCGFNSQPPEGGWQLDVFIPNHHGSFNSQPPEGGWLFYHGHFNPPGKFQLTAARRRLVGCVNGCTHPDSVSTHSRPKAAGATAK